MKTMFPDEQKLSRLFGEKLSFRLYDSTDSTQKRMREFTENGEDIAACIARGQTGGRGRLGKSFYSPYGAGIYATFSYPASLLPPDMPVTPAVALAVRSCIRKSTGILCGIKWVNDLYFSDKKVAGILCETFREKVLVGIGINLYAADPVPPELQNIYGTLPENAVREPEEMIGMLYESVQAAFLRSKAEVLSEYRKALVFSEKKAFVRINGEEFNGVIAGIDDDFRLLFQTENGLLSLSSGMVTLKIEQ